MRKLRSYTKKNRSILGGLRNINSLRKRQKTRKNLYSKKHGGSIKKRRTINSLRKNGRSKKIKRNLKSLKKHVLKGGGTPIKLTLEEENRLKTEPWYHGYISLDEVKKKLKTEKQFLVAVNEANEVIIWLCYKKFDSDAINVTNFYFEKDTEENISLFTNSQALLTTRENISSKSISDYISNISNKTFTGETSSQEYTFGMFLPVRDPNQAPTKAHEFGFSNEVQDRLAAEEEQLSKKAESATGAEEQFNGFGNNNDIENGIKEPEALWYYILNEADAEKMLKEFGYNNGNFLVRKDTSLGKFYISRVIGTKIKHFEIAYDKGGFKFDNTVFNNIEDMIDSNYQNKKIISPQFGLISQSEKRILFNNTSIFLEDTSVHVHINRAEAEAKLKSVPRSFLIRINLENYYVISFINSSDPRKFNHCKLIYKKEKWYCWQIKFGSVGYSTIDEIIIEFSRKKLFLLNKQIYPNYSDKEELINRGHPFVHQYIMAYSKRKGEAGYEFIEHFNNPPKEGEESFKSFYKNEVSLQEGYRHLNSKNRYPGSALDPYNDETRVILELDNKRYDSDYINASWVDGYKQKNAYIATQGPLKETMIDFWRMVWDKKVEVIVMVTNLIENDKKGNPKNKCQKYWPELGGPEFITKDERFIITNIKSVREDKSTEFGLTYIKSTLSVKKDGKESRQVTHIKYENWPDHGVPVGTESKFNTKALIAFNEAVNTISKDNTSPIIVHCSAGVGRTGTYIGLDIATKIVKDNKFPVIKDIVTEMRKYRAMAVQSKVQYEYLSKCILKISEKKKKAIRQKLNNFNTHFNYLTKDKDREQIEQIWNKTRKKYRTAVH